MLSIVDDWAAFIGCDRGWRAAAPSSLHVWIRMIGQVIVLGNERVLPDLGCGYPLDRVQDEDAPEKIE